MTMCERGPPNLRTACPVATSARAPTATLAPLAAADASRHPEVPAPIALSHPLSRHSHLVALTQ